MKNCLQMPIFKPSSLPPTALKYQDDQLCPNSISVKTYKVCFWILEQLIFFLKIQPGGLGMEIVGNQITIFYQFFLRDFQS